MTHCTRCERPTENGDICRDCLAEATENGGLEHVRSLEQLTLADLAEDIRRRPYIEDPGL